MQETVWASFMLQTADAENGVIFYDTGTGSVSFHLVLGTV